MAGSVVADTLQDGAGNSTSMDNAIFGSCKAWVNFNGVSGSVAIRASYNVSSITRNGTGDYTVNFTNALVDANYVIAGSAASTSGSDNVRALATGSGPSSGNNFLMTTTACRVQSVYTPGPQYFDCNYVNVLILR